MTYQEVAAQLNFYRSGRPDYVWLWIDGLDRQNDEYAGGENVNLYKDSFTKIDLGKTKMGCC
jgi:hypothetical protein